MSKRRHEEDWDDLEPMDLMPVGGTGRNSHSDQVFADFESNLSSSKKRSRSDRDDDRYEKDKRHKDKHHKDKHLKHKDKHHKGKEMHKDAKKRSKFEEHLEVDAVHHIASSSTESSKGPSSIAEEPRRAIPHDPELDLVNTDWMASPPPPSAWRKQPTAPPPPTAPKKPSSELNPQLNPLSTFETDGTFKVGDGGAHWARSTGSSSSSREPSSSSSGLPPTSSATSWRREEQAKQIPIPEFSPVAVVSPPSTRDADLSSIDLNVLKSQIMKAKLQKKMDLVLELEAKLDRARALQGSGSDGSLAAGHVRVIDDLDAYGRSRSAVSAVSNSFESDPRKAANPRTAGLHSASGERVKYFADDDQDLATMVARERAEKRGAGISSMDADYAENVMRKRNYKEADLFETHYDGDGDVDYAQWESRSKKLSSAELAQRERSSAIQSSQKMDKATANCFYCLKTKKVPAHLIISMGFHSTLMVPSRGYLLPGHCLIVPHEHYASSTTMEETVWGEVMQFMKALTKCFDSSKREPIFCETVLDFGPHRHTVIECYPIPKRDANMAPMFFQKAIKEFDKDEFSTTHQRVHEFTLPRQTIRTTIPDRFAYFMVQFGIESGLAHHIEKKAEFPQNFGKSVIGGIMRLDEASYSGRDRKTSYDEENKIVSAFKDEWKPYDWTSSLY